MKRATYFIAFCFLMVFASGCTAEPVTEQDYEAIYGKQKIKINSIENEEVKDSDI